MIHLRAGFPVEKRSELWGWLNSPRGFNFDDFGPDTESHFSLDLAARLKYERVWSIYSNEVIAGYIGFARQNSVSGLFRGMVIDPEMRGKGIGSCAFHLALSELADEGFRSFSVFTFSEGNPAIVKVLSGCGFREVGALPESAVKGGRLVPMSLWHRGVN